MSRSRLYATYLSFDAKIGRGLTRISGLTASALTV